MAPNVGKRQYASESIDAGSFSMGNRPDLWRREPSRGTRADAYIGRDTQTQEGRLQVLHNVPALGSFTTFRSPLTLTIEPG